MMDYKKIREYFEGNRENTSREKLERDMRFDPFLSAITLDPGAFLKGYRTLEPEVAVGLDELDMTMLTLYHSTAEAIYSGAYDDANFFHKSLEALVWEVENPED